MVLRTVLLTVTVVTMAGLLVIGVLLFKGRRDKIVKAASPSLLYLILVGSLLLYSETVIGILPADNVTCMTLPWIRHIGFAMTYGALLMKTWRISVIMKMFKTKVTRTKDAQLFRAVSILILISIVYMTVWTLTDPLQPTEQFSHPDHPFPKDPPAHRPPSPPVEHVEYQTQTEVTDAIPMSVVTDIPDTNFKGSQLVCILPWWDYVISAAEFCFLIWGGSLCYQARKAPDMYNETRPISYAIWNEALWCIFYAYATALVSKYPDMQMASILCFVRTQCTVTVTLLLLFVPKFMAVFSSLRELRGTVTDVYGAKRVHRLSLMLSKSGAIKTVYCVPCGPLSYAEVAEDEDDGNDSASENGDDNKEEQYTKAEVDTLIEMVSRLKNEKKIYKMQVKRLYHLLKEYRHKIPLNGLPVYLVAETPEQEQLPGQDIPQPLRTSVDGTCNPMFPDLSSTSVYSSTRTLPLCSPDSAKFDVLDIPSTGYNGHAYHNYLPYQSRKASTVTSFLSSTPDNTSINGETSDLISDEIGQVNVVDEGAKIVSPHSVTSPVCGYSSFTDPLAGQLPNSTITNSAEQDTGRINKSKADLSLDIPEPCQCAQSSNSDYEDDFPRLVEPRKRKFQTTESPQEIQDFISTICGKFGGNKSTSKPKEKVENQEMAQHVKSHEMDTLRNGKTNILENAMKLSSKALEQRRRGSGKSADKMSFVMYI